MKPPEPGITARAMVTEVIDGDTIDVELRLPVRVRLLDCWAPEPEGETRDAGLIARQAAVEYLMASAGEVLVEIPTKAAQGVTDVFSFGRVLGKIWPAGKRQTLGQMMIDGGFAMKDKEG
jgi:endonuclease YncB( thermonuclease family)